MGKAEASVDELVHMVTKGELRLPEMQREYVWRAPRVRDLLDSLYRGYPSGAILVWETDEAVPTRDFAIAQSGNAFRSTKLLLDGQQRLTSLSAIIRGEPVSVKGRKKPIDLLFNLEHPDDLQEITEVNEGGDVADDGADDDQDDDDEPDQVDASEDELLARFNRMTFVVATNKLAALPQWVRVSDVFKSHEDASFLEAAGVTGFKDPRYTRFSKRLAKLRAVRDYVYRMDVLERSLGYSEVTEIFVRVNSLGAKLRGSDLALAQITARWKNSLEQFQKFQNECAEMGFPLEIGVQLKNLVAFATGQSRFVTIGNVPLERLQSGWVDAQAGMRWALEFLRANCGVDSSALLSSPFAVIVLAYYAHQRTFMIPAAEAAHLKYWFVVANAKGRFSRGSSETILDQDLATIRNGGDVAALVDKLRTQVGRLEISVSELEGKNRRSSLFKTMFLAFQAAEAKDWHNGLAIAIDHSANEHKLQFHHIFPKAALRKQGVTGAVVDDIANLCFISGKTNRSISDRAPVEYFADIADPTTMDAQEIPSDPDLLELPAFHRFLAARRGRIAVRLNSYLESLRPEVPAVTDQGQGSPATEVVGARGVLVVEGETDLQYLEVAAEKVGRLDLLDGLRIVVGGGADKVALVALQEKQRGLPVLALFDSDAPGRVGRDRLKGLGFAKHELMTYAEVLGHPSAEAEAEDLWPAELLDQFVKLHGEDAVISERRQHAVLKRWCIGLNARGKDLISEFLRDSATSSDASAWHELLVEIRARLGM